MSVKNFYDLEVWQKGRERVKAIYELTNTFPKEEQYGLSAQLRRAAISVPSNIAEGHSRHGTKDFTNFISIAIGSLAETDTQVILAQDLGYISQNQCQHTLDKIHRLQRMLHSLRHALKTKDSPIPNPTSPIPA